MGYGLQIHTFTETKYFRRLSYNDLHSLNDMIIEKRELLHRIQKEIILTLLLAKVSSDKHIDETVADVITTLTENFDEYENNLYELFILEDLKNLIEEDKVALYDEVSGKYFIKKNGSLIEVDKNEYTEYVKKLTNF